MARYTGPRSKISRRHNAPIFGPSKSYDRRSSFPPGVHGNKGRRKLSDYALALSEKQKLRFSYGIMEKQFEKYYKSALKGKGITGEKLLQYLELRLDNIVFRLGMAISRRLARQMVTHGHIRVNGVKCSIASRQCRAGDIIEVRESPKSRQLATRGLEYTQVAPLPAWLTLQKEVFKGTVVRVPTKEDIQPIANEQLVVELYSKA